MRPVLHRIRQGRPQVELDRAARAGNIRGAFVAEARALAGLRVALVDDVTTTGATLADAAAAARAAGARRVRAYVVAVEE
jgi:predicted amidophosphoribosyltransferase